MSFQRENRRRNADLPQQYRAPEAAARKPLLRLAPRDVVDALLMRFDRPFLVASRDFSEHDGAVAAAAAEIVRQQWC